MKIPENNPDHQKTWMPFTRESIINITKILPSALALFHQDKLNWCWAAGTSYVADCLSKYKAQCEIVSACIQHCVSDCHGKDCDVPYFLETSLRSVKHFSDWREGKATLTEIRKEIAQHKPVGVRIQWAGGGGHIILIVGIGASSQRPNIPRFAVFDPHPEVGLHIIRASTLVQDRYQMVGAWSETFFTK